MVELLKYWIELWRNWAGYSQRISMKVSIFQKRVVVQQRIDNSEPQTKAKRSKQRLCFKGNALVWTKIAQEAKTVG
jgi:hypothetical protein